MLAGSNNLGNNSNNGLNYIFYFIVSGILLMLIALIFAYIFCKPRTVCADDDNYQEL